MEGLRADSECRFEVTPHLPVFFSNTNNITNQMNKRFGGRGSYKDLLAAVRTRGGGE